MHLKHVRFPQVFSQVLPFDFLLAGKLFLNITFSVFFYAIRAQPCVQFLGVVVIIFLALSPQTYSFTCVCQDCG